MPAMTDAAVMQDLFVKFQEFRRSGKDALLTMECNAGEAWLQLRVHLLQLHQQHRQKQRKPGPSRLRRRARRVEARAAAEVAAATNDSAAKTREKAVEADPLPPPQVACHGPAEQVDDKVHDTPHHPTEQADAVNSTIKTSIKAAQLNVNANPWPHGDVPDVFCPDSQYLQQQQLNKPQAPPNQCKVCGKTFGSSRALTSHIRKDHTV